MSRAEGEAAWTARDICPGDDFIVTDPLGTIHGYRPTEAEAVVLREELGAAGVECWVVPVHGLEIEEGA